MRIIKLWLLMPLLILTIAATGCGGDEPENSETMENEDDVSLTSADEIVIRIENDIFNPPQLTIPLGTTVTWQNVSSGAHTVTSGIEPHIIVDSGPIEPGGTFEFTFNDTTAFEYYSRNAENTARGIIVVMPEEVLEERREKSAESEAEKNPVTPEGGADTVNQQ